jgi:hypothetical protein
MGAKKPDWTAPASKWAMTEAAHAASIGRIIREIATTPQGKKLVQNVDRDRLAGELIHAWSQWLATSTRDSEFKGHALKQRAQLFYDLVESAENFKERLLDKGHQGYVATQIGSRFPAQSEFRTFLVGLDQIIEFAEDNAQLYGHGKWLRENRPPTEQFVRDILPEIFERCFDQKAGKSENGPYSRFARAVLKEFGEEYSSVRRARSHKPRRSQKMQR